MISLPLSPKVIQKKKNQAVFQIEALYPGYGVTIGNALRRVLLSSLPGAAVTEVKIKGAQHEYSTIPGVLEDVITIMQNLKNLRFKIFEGDAQKAQLKIKGEKEIKGSDFKLPSQLKLYNPDCHVATLTNSKAEFEIEIQVERGIGYETQGQRKKKKSEIGMISLDAIFTPIKNVSFQIENIRVGERTDYDKLNLDIETDGTITPEEAFLEACQIIIRHFVLLAEAPAILPEKTAKKETDKKKATKAKKETKPKPKKKTKN
ncbi:DNA-directed RNA polymerase subunit alpha [Patescibacteria group bacterium]|nr:DNA-directed RNA polymerase subunit alpha [Patescibacteria group bacterium]